MITYAEEILVQDLPVNEAGWTHSNSNLWIFKLTDK